MRKERKFDCSMGIGRCLVVWFRSKLVGNKVEISRSYWSCGSFVKMVFYWSY